MHFSVQIRHLSNAKMWATIAFISITIIYILTKWYVKNKKFMKLMDQFPNPPKVPIFGNTLDFKSSAQLFSKFTEYTELYGDKVKLYIGIIPSDILISDVRVVGHVLSSTTILSKGLGYRFLSNWLGKGLVMSDGDGRWKKHRKLIAPSFNIQILKKFMDAFNSNSNILISKLEAELGKTSFDVYPYITLCSLDIICETAMGTSIRAQNNSNSKYVKSVKLMCKVVVQRTYNAFLRIDFFYNFSSLHRKEKEAVQILHEHTMDIIRKRKKLHDTNKNTVNRKANKSKKALLDLLIEQNKISATFTDEEIREEVDTFMFAGHDTTASALTFSIFCLAENPLVQTKVVKELSDIFGDDKLRSVTFNDVQKMRYLEAVIKEALRLYPPVPYYSRIVQEEFEFDGYTYPKGVTLLLNIYGIHHNSKFFKEPKKFNPERFLGENIEEKHNYNYLPFSSGLRNCIGQKFAMLEIKTVLAILLRHYEFFQVVPSHQLQLAPEAVLLSKNGVHIRIVRRNN